MISVSDLDFDYLIGQEVGTSTLLKELARGGMGIVFVAYQRTLKRQIAVKVLPKFLITDENTERFQQEAEAAAILSHPNIVTIYEVGTGETFLFISMQLIKGRSLLETIDMAKNHVLPSRRFLPLKMSLDTMIGVLDALDYAHGQDIIHKDIKPANILIETHTQRPIITDFGLAETTRGPRQTSSRILGTPTYMAPELLLGEPGDRRVDVYSSGVMLFEMLASNLPLPAYGSLKDFLKTRLELGDGLFQARPSELNPKLNPGMDEIVAKAVSFHPEKRYGNCGEFRDALRAYSDRYVK